MIRTGRLAFVAAVALPCLVALVLATGDLQVPGPYYDEVIQAVPAVEFLSADGAPPRLPGMQSARIGGRWFPVMTQAYMGAFKSQLLIPIFAVFGATLASLRVSTFALGLAGALLVGLFAARTLGRAAAATVVALLVLDPSFLFVARQDLGSFSIALLCKGAGLALLAAGGARGGRLAFAGGLALGLGVYNKIDFAIFPVAAGVAWFLADPRGARTFLRERPRRAWAPAAGFLLGAAPMLVAAGGALAATRMSIARTAAGPGSADWSEKLSTFATMLDGSHFHRLMRAGGDFDRIGDVTGAAHSAFGWVFATCAVFLAVRVARARRTGRANPADAFVLFATGIVFVATFATPRAVRIHHVLGVLPFPQLVVAAAVGALWRVPRWTGRAAAATLVAVALAGHALVDVRTLEFVRASGGKGRWSDALTAYAEELGSRPDDVVVSLDWGFHEPLRFLARDANLSDPVWRLQRDVSAHRTWSFDGSARHVYLVHPADAEVFEFGAPFLEAVAALPPERVEIREHRDREGDTAFLSVRFAGPHRLVYAGRFEVILP